MIEKELEPQSVFHIVSKDDWATYSSGDSYSPASLKTEGFIHMSTRDQVIGSADLFFKGRVDLLLLEVEIFKSDQNLKWEPAADGSVPKETLFPHYYSKLPIDAVKKIFKFQPKTDGTFAFPDDLSV